MQVELAESLMEGRFLKLSAPKQCRPNGLSQLKQDVSLLPSVLKPLVKTENKE